jgi:Sec7-like guanine-nucleotide exchange factor
LQGSVTSRQFIDDEAPWDIASKILLYSRELTVEMITEILGGKEDRNKKIYGHFLDKQDWRDNSLEMGLRRVMQTFRLAGVESQCVTRVLEGFAAKYFEFDSNKTFVDTEEAYEMAFLLIVLQTT